MANYLAIIPARGGSKGIPRKNLKPLAGKPLIAWSIEAARASKKIARTVVSTDDGEIAAVAKKYGAEVPFMRPAELATDTAATEPVLLHVLEKLEQQPDAVVLLQATSPLRLPGTIDRAIAQFEAEGADSLVGVCENHHFFWKRTEALYDFKNRPRRQDIEPDDRWYRENGSIYVTRTGLLRGGRNRLGGKIALFVMDEVEGWEIDTEADFRVLEALMHNRS